MGPVEVPAGGSVRLPSRADLDIHTGAPPGSGPASESSAASRAGTARGARWLGSGLKLVRPHKRL